MLEHEREHDSRWLFDRRVDVLGELRKVRLVVKVPRGDKRPLVVSTYPLDEIGAATEQPQPQPVVPPLAPRVPDTRF